MSADVDSRSSFALVPKILSHLSSLCRLLQNRKSAKKCRLKKKAEFSVLACEVDAMKKDNKDMHEKVRMSS